MFNTTPTLHDSIGAKRAERREHRAAHLVKAEIIEAIKAKKQAEYDRKLAAWRSAHRTVFNVPAPVSFDVNGNVRSVGGVL